VENLILAVGGTDKARRGGNRKEIYTFAEAADLWTYIGDLPAPRFDAAVAVVSSTEILVIGGWGGDTAQERVNTVYKGVLKLADY
jgi:N-acetylneuraminic acid mutarotase